MERGDIEYAKAGDIHLAPSSTASIPRRLVGELQTVPCVERDQPGAFSSGALPGAFVASGVVE